MGRRRIDGTVGDGTLGRDGRADLPVRRDVPPKAKRPHRPIAVAGKQGLHEDHHTVGQAQVGRDADPVETARLIARVGPDVIQIHAKGNPGWTTYPSEVCHTPPKLARDVLGIWRDIARRDGYPFSAYYNIGRAGEIMTRRPAWNRVQADGKPWDRALCYHSGVAEGYLWPMVREIIEEYRPGGFWFDGSCFTVRVCCCEKCRERFRRENDLEPPQTPGTREWRAYQQMQRQIYREFMHETAARIHQVDPDCLVAVNWAYSLRMPEKPDAGIAYLTGDIGNRVKGLSAEAHWCDAQGLPFDLMTQINTRYEGGRTGQAKGPARMAPKPRGQIEQEMAIIIANGGRYFAWDTATPESGLVPERFDFMAEVVGPFLRARNRAAGRRRCPGQGAPDAHEEPLRARAGLLRADPPLVEARQERGSGRLAGIGVRPGAAA